MIRKEIGLSIDNGGLVAVKKGDGTQSGGAANQDARRARILCSVAQGRGGAVGRISNDCSGSCRGDLNRERLAVQSAMVAEFGIGNEANDRAGAVSTVGGGEGKVTLLEGQRVPGKSVGDVLALARVRDNLAGDLHAATDGWFDESEVAAACLIEAEVGVVIPAGIEVVGGRLSGGKDEEKLVGRKGMRGKRPLGQLSRVIGEIPSVERDGSLRRVPDFDPVA